MKPIRRHVEHDMQKAFIKAARKVPGCEWIYAIPNAVPVRIRDKEDAKLARIKAQQYATAEGRLPGVLDLFLPRPALFRFLPGPNNIDFHGLYMEFKRPEMVINGKHKLSGELSEDQARFILYADSEGYAVAISRSIQAAMDTTLKYLRGEHSNEPALQEAREFLIKRYILQQAQTELDRSKSLRKRLEKEYGVKK
jgi:hypothetical protein